MAKRNDNTGSNYSLASMAMGRVTKAWSIGPPGYNAVGGEEDGKRGAEALHRERYVAFPEYVSLCRVKIGDSSCAGRASTENRAKVVG